MDCYYVCARCAHSFAAPERPGRCEHCREHGSWLACAGHDLERAEQLSEQALARRRGGAGGSGHDDLPSCGWRAQAIAPEIEPKAALLVLRDLVYSGQELREWPPADGGDEAPLAR